MTAPAKAVVLQLESVSVRVDFMALTVAKVYKVCLYNSSGTYSKLYSMPAEIQS